MRITRHARRLFTVAVALAAVVGSPAAADAATFAVTPLAGRTFVAPTWVGGAPGGATLYVAEQRGIVWATTGSRRWIFLDVRRGLQSGGERGLLSIAFATDYRTSGRLYVYMTMPDGTGQVRQFRASHGRIVSGSGRVTMRVSLAPSSAPNHNGGTLWTTATGALYLSVGDGGGEGSANAQRLDRLQGKLLRVIPRPNGGYLIPRSNPFVSRAGARGEIYALGLRNPWRFSIDRPTGDIWIGDVGESTLEEVDRLPGGAPAGANFGWRRIEGTRLNDPTTTLTSGTRSVSPVLTYTHASGGCSITGGLVYRGPVAALRGRYLYADYCTDTVTAFNPTTRRREVVPALGGIVHFGTTSDGSVYLASQQSGTIARITAP